MDFQEYIKPELLILIPVLYLIGTGIKYSTAKDKFIPLVLGVVGVVLAGLYIFSTEDINGAQAIVAAFFTAFTQGVLCAGASVYADQLVKQARKDD